MECSLAALIACFSWSNLYVDTSLSYLDVKQIYVVDGERRSDYVSPYGGLSLGFAVPFKDGQISLEATHISSIVNSHDRGINSISLHARWFPFRR